MYKAVHAQSGQEIIILSSLWAAQGEFLREMGQADQLVCPGCRQPVQARLGDIRVWHFAHKHLENCPFENETAQRLWARAALYTWLVERAGEDEVEMEVKLAGRVPHPMDCALKTSRAGFWVFDRRMPPDEREALAAAVNDRPMNWFFTAELLHTEADRPDLLYLTTTEREFMRTSAYDQAWQRQAGECGKTLHYLAGVGETLVTYRNLRLLHQPQVYIGQRLESALSEVALTASGEEPVHPGEEQQRSWQQMSAEIALQKEQARLQRAQEKLQKLTRRPNPDLLRQGGPQQSLAAETPFTRAGVCRRCGSLTSDWVAWFGQTNECICRQCGEQD